MTDTPHQDSPSAPSAGATFGGCSPILRVRSVQASVTYYRDALGFALDWGPEAGIASVSRGGCTLFLCEGDQGNPGSWVWIGVDDAEAAERELRARGATIRQPPTNFAWALELQVEDPDGNVLRLGSDPKADVPYGPWRDMHGELWMPRAEGSGWERVSATATTDTAKTDTAKTGGADTADTVAVPAGEDVVGRVRALKLDGERARRAGDLAGARALYEQAVAMQRAHDDDPLELAHSVRHLGDVLHDARLPHLAEPHYREALALYRAHPSPPPLNLANAIRSHAVLKHEIGEVEASRRLWEEAARLYQQVNQREGVAESAAWAARLAWRAGDLSRAREWLAAARAASDASSDPATWRFVREVGLELGG
jgi:predicted enzyme related to lactoylglutathione lyase